MKRIIQLLSVFLLGIMMTTTSLSAMGLVSWKGSPKVENTMSNLDNLDTVIKKLKDGNVRDTNYYEEYAQSLINAIKENEKLIAGRDTSIKELQDAVIQRDAQIEELSAIIEKLELENEQALKDVQMIDEKVTSILETNK